MRTRREQVQAYRFVIRRIVSALLSGEPERPDQPMRRLSLSLVASTMIAAIVLAGAGIFGLLTGQSAPLEPNTLIIEAETEARFVYVDESLYPVLNYTSARLILGSSEPNVRRLSRSKLQDLPRGHQVGIPDAPDSLPATDALLELPWQICSVPPNEDSPAPSTVAVIGQQIAGATAPGSQALYVTDGSHRYLLWNNTLLRITEPIALVTLGLSAVEPIRVGDQLMNAVTAGPDLEVVLPDGFGEPSSVEIDGEGAIIGFVYQAGDQHYVMTREGLVPIGELTVALRQSVATVRVREISGAQASRALASNQPLEPEGFPRTAPEIHPDTGRALTICSAYRGTSDGTLATTVEVFTSVPDVLSPAAPNLVQVAQTERDVVAVVDRVLIAGGQGALVDAVPTATATVADATTYLITAQGVKYPLGVQAGDARAALGYGGVTPTAVPMDLLDLLPTGPTLDIGDAGLPVDAPGVDRTEAEAGG